MAGIPLSPALSGRVDSLLPGPHFSSMHRKFWEPKQPRPLA